MNLSPEIGKYLGFPLSKKRKPSETFQYIVDQVRSKLEAWKANSLSMASRITLSKSVLSSIPLYPMQVAQIPKKICTEAERRETLFGATVILVGVAVWKLWNRRNSAAFDTTFTRPINTSAYLRNWKLYSMNTNCDGEANLNVNYDAKTSYSWISPPPKWIKLNVYGAMALNSYKVGCGGLLRDFKGHWIVGFA
ncbi:uncharacterized protein LOC114727945 [Neltuma alba]|uniref:uncharacterized protein LOC114727945 n=1 Tax=Neltuma alba TaxID=207710 RepID=UPI0010A2CDD5|nr:uncharacterized protein LOC114727945 [Prosopis alba]